MKNTYSTSNPTKPAFKSTDEAINFAKTKASGSFVAFISGWQDHILIQKEEWSPLEWSWCYGS